MGKGHQIFVAFVGSFGNLLMGSLNVWPSYTVGVYAPKNITNETELYLDREMTDSEVSLMGSLPSLGAMIGTGLAGPVLNKLGKKRGSIVIGIPIILCWAMVELSLSPTLVLAARLLGGITGGAALFLAPSYISEIAEDDIRGMLAAVPLCLYGAGMIFSYCCGWFSTYHLTIWLNVTACVLWPLMLMLVTESPMFLLKQKRDEEAAAALAKLRGGLASSKHIQEELSRLRQSLIPSTELVAVKTADPDEEKAPENEKSEKVAEPELEDEAERAKTNVFKLLFSGASARAFGVVMFTGTAQVFMGMVAIQVFTRDLFAVAAPELSSHFCSVLVAVVMLLGSGAASVVADKAGRRFLELTSAALVTTCMWTLGYLMQSNVAPAWVSAVFVLVYCFAFMFGVGAVPYILLAEVFNSEVKDLASFLFIEWAWFTNFVIIFLFKPLVAALGMHWVFYIFGLVGAIGGVGSYFILPETKGLSTQQIQEVFGGRR